MNKTIAILTAFALTFALHSVASADTCWVVTYFDSSTNSVVWETVCNHDCVNETNNDLDQYALDYGLTMHSHDGCSTHENGNYTHTTTCTSLEYDSLRDRTVVIQCTTVVDDETGIEQSHSCGEVTPA